MFTITNSLIGIRALCFLAAFLTCLNFMGRFRCFAAELSKARIPSDGLYVGAAIFVQGLGLMFLTGFRTLQIFYLPGRGLCPDQASTFIWVEIGYLLVACGCFMHCIGKSNQSGNVYLGYVGLIGAATASFLLTLYGMAANICG